MIRNYWTADEFYRSYPIRSLTKTADLPGILGKAAFQVGQDLRERGNNSTGFQIPVMFETSLASFEARSFTGDVTSASASGLGSSRFVVDCTVKPDNDAVITLECTTDSDPDGNSIWLSVIAEDNSPVSIRVQDAMLYTVPFAMQGNSYRYKVDTDDAFTARVYLVDGATDELVGLKALINILYPLQDGANERIDSMLLDARTQYDDRLARLVTAYDSDGDGDVDADESNTRKRIYAYR